jgi:hypothetical protein
VWRYCAVFTDSSFVLLQAKEQRRDHAIIEQVLADWISGPLAYLPSGSFPPTPPGSPSQRSATTCCTPPALGQPHCTQSRGATLRRDLSEVAARLVRHDRGTSLCTCPKAGTAS